jgi:hypothetical protein
LQHSRLAGRYHTTTRRIIIDSVPNAKKLHDFTITAGVRQHEVRGRRDAVSHAKELSGRMRHPVIVERADNRMRMRFAGGSLQEYTFETRPGRRQS